MILPGWKGACMSYMHIELVADWPCVCPGGTWGRWAAHLAVSPAVWCLSSWAQ